MTFINTLNVCSSLRYWYRGFYTNLKNRLTCISKTKKARWHRPVEDLKTSARNVEYSRGVMNKPSRILKIIDGCLDNCEATIEPLTLYIVTRLKGIIPNLFQSGFFAPCELKLG